MYIFILLFSGIYENNLKQTHTLVIFILYYHIYGAI